MDAGPDITPEQAIATWREHFPEFWPKGNRFAGALTGLQTLAAPVTSLRRSLKHGAVKS
jgi:hypothetical protein